MKLVVLVIFFLTKKYSGVEMSFSILQLDGRLISFSTGDIVTLDAQNKVTWLHCTSNCQTNEAENTQVGEGRTLKLIVTEATAGKYSAQDDSLMTIGIFDLFVKDPVKYTSPGSYKPTLFDLVEVRTVGKCESVEFQNSKAIDYANDWITYCAEDRLLRFSAVLLGHYGIFVDGDATFAFTMIKDRMVISLGDRLPETIAVIFPSTTLVVMQDKNDPNHVTWKIGDQVIGPNNTLPVFIDNQHSLIVRDWTPPDGTLAAVDPSRGYYNVLNVLAIYETHQILLPAEKIIFGSMIQISCVTTLRDLEFIQLFVNDHLVARSTSSKIQNIVYKHHVLETSFYLKVSCNILASYNGNKRFNKTSITRKIWKSFIESEGNNIFTVTSGDSVLLIYEKTPDNPQPGQWYLNDTKLVAESRVISIENVTKTTVLSYRSEMDPSISIKIITFMTIPYVSVDNSTYDNVWLPRDKACSLICRAEHQFLLRVYWKNTFRPQNNTENYAEMKFVSNEHRHPTSYICSVEYLSEGIKKHIDMYADVTFYTSRERISELFVGETTVLRASNDFPENVSWATYIRQSQYNAVDRLTLNYRNDLLVQMEAHPQIFIMMSPNMFTFDQLSINAGELTPLRLAGGQETASLAPGDPLELRCSIVLSQDPEIDHFYWYHYLSPEAELGKSLPNDNIVLEIKNVAINDSGRYMCAVEYTFENEKRTMEKSFEVSVKGYEMIDDGQSETFVKKEVGAHFTFTFGLRVNPSTGYVVRWTHKSQEVPSVKQTEIKPFYAEFTYSIRIPLDETGTKAYLCEIMTPESTKHAIEKKITIVENPTIGLRTESDKDEAIFICNVSGYFTMLEIFNYSDLMISKKNLEHLMIDDLKYRTSRGALPYNITCKVTQSTQTSVLFLTKNIQSFETSKSNSAIAYAALAITIVCVLFVALAVTIYISTSKRKT